MFYMIIITRGDISGWFTGMGIRCSGQDEKGLILCTTKLLGKKSTSGQDYFILLNPWYKIHGGFDEHSCTAFNQFRGVTEAPESADGKHACRGSGLHVDV